MGLFCDGSYGAPIGFASTSIVPLASARETAAGSLMSPVTVRTPAGVALDDPRPTDEEHSHEESCTKGAVGSAGWDGEGLVAEPNRKDETLTIISFSAHVRERYGHLEAQPPEGVFVRPE